MAKHGSDSVCTEDFPCRGTRRKGFRGPLCALATAFSLLSVARANLCSDDASIEGLAEAEALETEQFSLLAGFDLIGDQDYNAKVITCNRKRDSHGDDVDGESMVSFADDLDARTVKGQYSYFGLGVISSLRYAYDIRREEGTWIVTVPARIHWPARKRSMVDIPLELAEDLGLTASGQICEPGGTVLSTLNPRKIEEGHVPWELPLGMQTSFEEDQEAIADPEDPIFTTRASVTTDFDSRIDSILQQYDVVYYWDEESCRVPRDMIVNNMGMLHHFFSWFEQVAEDGWSRPGFVVDLRFLDCDDPPGNTLSACNDNISQRERNAWEKDETIWELHLNLEPFHRPSYKRWLFKLDHMHTGSHSSTVIHELGHQLGLDDEYGESSSAPKDCTQELSNADDMYLMCSANTAKGAGFGTNVDLEGSKGVYPWIITRRYCIAREYQCKVNADCPTGEYCDTGTLTIGRNTCTPFKDEGDTCSADKQCEPPATCAGFPPMRCVVEASKELGDSCFKNIECVTDKCEGGECVCTSDSDCPSGEECKTPALSQNYCTENRALGASCERDHQCASDKCESDECVCKTDSDCSGSAECKTPALGQNYCTEERPLGRRCDHNHQCASDKCESDECVCKTDGDCSGGSECKTPATAKNFCTEERALGRSCDHNDQCASDKCEGGDCVCKNDSDCPGSSECKTPLTSQNYCTEERSLGSRCGRNDQCASDKCEGGECVCKRNSDCPGSQKCKTPAFSKNYCK